MPKAVLNVSGEALRVLLGLPANTEIYGFRECEDSGFTPLPTLQIKVGHPDIPVLDCNEGESLPAVSWHDGKWA